MKQKTQKTIVLILTVLMLVPSAFLYKPQRTEAFLGIGGDEAEIAIGIKEYILDPIAYAFINMMVSEMSKQAIKWINDPNFLGPGGGYTPGFITKPGEFLWNVGDAALGEYIRDVQPFLCSPFRVDVRLALETKYKSSKNRDYCTLTKVGGNVGKAYENFINDFNKGGWKKWVEITVNPGNNRYGSVVKADAEAFLTIGDKKIGESANLARGFLDQKKEECVKRATKTKLMEDGFHWVDEIDRDLGKVIPGFTPPCVLSETTTITPGTFLQTQVSEAIGDSKGRLRIADEIDELIGTLLSKLVMIGFDELGLLNTGIGGSENNKNQAKRRIEAIIDSIIAKTQEYIGIKKSSLELTGKFELSGTQLGTVGEVKQKINWAKNDFEWRTGIYYKEDRSSKIDWMGESFAWRNETHYGEKDPITGVIKEAECRTLEDTELPASYVTNDGILSPFWNKSECLNIKDTNGVHIEYKWGTTTPTTRENSFARAVSVSCSNSRSVGTMGYIIITESDGFWSASSCQRINDAGAVDWSGITITNKETYRTKSTRYLEKKVNWDGILFNWDEDGSSYFLGGAEYSDQITHGFIDQYISPTDYSKPFPPIPQVGILKIEAMATPPKICYPAERQTDMGQVEGEKVAGVIEGQNKGYERWTMLKCTNAPGDSTSEISLKNFRSMMLGAFPNSLYNVNEFGAWVKFGETPPAQIRIPLEGVYFDNLMENYGSVPIKTMFENLLECYEEKQESELISQINSQINKRKEQRLQIIADILLAEKMIENAKTLKNTAEREIMYYSESFLTQLTEIQKTVGISDSQISEARGEKGKIETENTLVSALYETCVNE